MKTNYHLFISYSPIWKKKELTSLLGNDYELFADYYNVNRKGYWEHDNYILLRDEDEVSLAKKHNLSLEDLQAKMGTSKAILMKERDTRIRPGLDDKTLTSWNGLMLKGYVDAYLTFGDEHFLDVAIENANFILSKPVSKAVIRVA